MGYAWTYRHCGIPSWLADLLGETREVPATAIHMDLTEGGDMEEYFPTPLDNLDEER